MIAFPGNKIIMALCLEIFIQFTVDRSVIDVSYQINDKQTSHQAIYLWIDDSMELPPAI